MDAYLDQLTERFAATVHQVAQRWEQNSFAQIEVERLVLAHQERLSPLGFAHINFHGRFSFNLPETVQQGQLRPLRTPKLTDPVRFAFT